jgi:hypothetical protein
MSDDKEPPRSRAWRSEDGPLEMFGGKLVNRKRLSAPDMMNCDPRAITKFVKRGMPSIKNGQRHWFRPDACLGWFEAQEQSKGKPPGAGD